MKLTTREWIALVSIASVISAGMYLGFTLDVTHASNVKEVMERQNIVQYDTERETYLYNKVEKTVDLPGFGDYQDLLASYAYNNCNKVFPGEKGKYSCENLVKTWNSENGGWRRDATNTSNGDGSHDGGLCQLNSSYHSKFIKSNWFNNPLAQLDYCLGVWKDARSKGTMPRYGYDVRHKRDKGIVFAKGETSPLQQANNLGKIYDIARAKQDEADKLRKVCLDVGVCLPSL